MQQFICIAFPRASSNPSRSLGHWESAFATDMPLLACQPASFDRCQAGTAADRSGCLVGASLGLGMLLEWWTSRPAAPRSGDAAPPRSCRALTDAEVRVDRASPSPSAPSGSRCPSAVRARRTREWCHARSDGRPERTGRPTWSRRRRHARVPVHGGLEEGAVDKAPNRRSVRSRLGSSLIVLLPSRLSPPPGWP